MYSRTIYRAPRDQSFREMLEKVISLGMSPEKTREIISKGLDRFSTAFTHSSFDPNHNYEFWETLGDVTLNKCVLWYISRRFPQLNGPDGSDLLTRLKIKIIKTESFSAIAKQLDFSRFISIDKAEYRTKTEEQVLEDVFEAFTAVLEFTVDERFGEGFGYKVCYTILSTLLDHSAITLSYDDIMDYKTRLKELFDAFKNILGNVEYTTQKSYGKVEVWRKPSDKYTVDIPLKLSESTSEQEAAKKALEKLSELGYKKNIPSVYIKFCM